MFYQIKVFGATYDYWYDKKSRMWAYAPLDADCNLEEAKYTSTKEYALVHIGIHAATGS